MNNTKAKNTICLWFDKDALDAARLYAATFPDSEVTVIHKAPGDYPNGKEGEILVVEFTVCGIPCVGLNGGPQFSHTEAFSFQIATDTQEEADRCWNAIVSNGGAESACGWCKNQLEKWRLSRRVSRRHKNPAPPRRLAASQTIHRRHQRNFARTPITLAQAGWSVGLWFKR